MASEAVAKSAPYPAKTRTATGTVSGIPTEAEVTYFKDKIMVLVSQSGRLAQWIQVPLSAPSAASLDAVLMPGIRGASSSTSLLPATHLTPRTLFGAGGETRETFGQLVAAQIGSFLSLRDPGETRTIVVGLGLDPPQRQPGTTSSEGDVQAQTTYFDVVELVQKAL
ncbi:hypothetical protein F503_08596 [Ophiostoma piceae UAMH 11346]|uniref:Proteasome assembly chaperone 3 n=1 Tax=Ophiostoma piceae (strain UAMH 11346) TaxID=1262450 RepID=S3BM44_OPHP1|nr:hypothetical protein F503_08596 [Ophiostoma piceae UAMH 11346]